jgi:hypothetical protein
MWGKLIRRAFPLIASAILIAVTMGTTTLGPALIGRTQWALPFDYWGTLVAAVRLAHFDVGGIYTQPTGLVSLPGTAVILLPVAAVISAAGLSLGIPGPHNPHPAVWMVAGPYQVAISCVALFAADALAERLWVPRGKRMLLAAASGVALWNVAGRWGHPEDAVAVGLLLYAILALSRSQVPLAGWLTGFAVGVQPLVLLAVPVLAAVLPPRRIPAFLVRGALPSVALLGAAAIANWSATYTAVTSQPNSPSVNHPTLWTGLAPHMSGGDVAAGPARALTILLACCCALALRRRWHAGRAISPDAVSLASGIPVSGSLASGAAADAPGGTGTIGVWSSELLSDVLWWSALALALRSFFEPVMVSYYLWPVLAAGLIPTATLTWRRLIAASVVASAVTGLAQGSWHNVWLWWLPVIAGLVALLALGRRLRISGNRQEHGVDPAVVTS